VTEHQDPDESTVTEKFLDAKLSGFRSEMRLLFVVAIAGNSLLSHIQISPVTGAISSGAAVFGALLVKALLVR
jgi:hypothetical protein